MKVYIDTGIWTVCWQQIYYVAPILLGNAIPRQVLNDNMLPISSLINERTIVVG